MVTTFPLRLRQLLSARPHAIRACLSRWMQPMTTVLLPGTE